MSAPTLKVDAIGHVILYVKDVEKAAAFYRDALGIPASALSPTWGELATKGTVLALHQADQPPPVHVPSLPVVVFNVDDIRAAHAALKAKGVKIHSLETVWESAESTVLSAEFHDLDGNTLSICGVVPK